MIKKTDLLMTLSTIRDIEEKGTALALEAIEKALPESGLSGEERKWLLEEVLKVILRDSERHMTVVEGIIAQVKGDKRHVL